MTKKRGKIQKRMQTQAKPSNRANERSMVKTTDNIYENEQLNYINKEK